MKKRIFFIIGSMLAIFSHPPVYGMIPNWLFQAFKNTLRNVPSKAMPEACTTMNVLRNPRDNAMRPIYIDVLDDSGIPTGQILSKEEIHATGALHRAVHLYLFNNAGNILLQRRALTVDHYPGLWSISLTGHIEVNEGTTAALFRELNEELGMTSEDVMIEHLFSYRRETTLSPTYIDRQINEVFWGFCTQESPSIVCDKAEVSETTFVPFAEFLAMTEDSSSQLAPVYQEVGKKIATYLKARLELKE